MSISLTYFDYDGSRGLECRLALTTAGVDFEDIRVTRDQWLTLKSTLPYGALPVLTVDGSALPQSTAILGYVGRSYGLHPSDPWKAAEHDALMLSVEDLRAKIPGAKGLDEAALKAAREAFAVGWLHTWATTVSERVTGPYVDGDHLSVTDVKLYVILRAFINGGYDHIPGSYFDAHPKLQHLHAAVDAHPAVQGYFATR